MFSCNLDAKAQLKLGCKFYKGQKVSRYMQEAARWFRLSADQGYAVAQYHLGVMYLKGEGVLKDAKEAARWYHLSAEQGYAAAQYELSNLYDYDDNYFHEWQPKDLEKEKYRWLILAANQGYTKAEVALGKRYKEGSKFLIKDEKEAVRLFQLAAEKGNVEAQFELAIAYQNGEGVQKDLQIAARWYQMVADHKYLIDPPIMPMTTMNENKINAHCALGWMFENGEGVKKDGEEAAKQYYLARKKGSRALLQLYDREIEKWWGSSIKIIYYAALHSKDYIEDNDAIIDGLNKLAKNKTKKFISLLEIDDVLDDYNMLIEPLLDHKVKGHFFRKREELAIKKISLITSTRFFCKDVSKIIVDYAYNTPEIRHTKKK